MIGKLGTSDRLESREAFVNPWRILLTGAIFFKGKWGKSSIFIMSLADGSEDGSSDVLGKQFLGALT